MVICFLAVLTVLRKELKQPGKYSFSNSSQKTFLDHTELPHYRGRHLMTTLKQSLNYLLANGSLDRE